ncbi:hypothetical protein FIV04_02700 [Vibrio sp. THAF190c]|nr:hypothetical protein FIV04_02700 [Vibrio sp. THAF190c]
MAGMERFDWAGTPVPTRAILNITRIHCFESRVTVQHYKYEKGSSLSTRALKVAGVERFDWAGTPAPNTRYLEYNGNTLL